MWSCAEGSYTDPSVSDISRWEALDHVARASLALIAPAGLRRLQIARRAASSHPAMSR